MTDLSLLLSVRLEEDPGGEAGEVGLQSASLECIPKGSDGCRWQLGGDDDRHDPRLHFESTGRSGLVNVCSSSMRPTILDLFNGHPLSPSDLSTALNDLNSDLELNTQHDLALTNAMSYGLPMSSEVSGPRAWNRAHPKVMWPVGPARRRGSPASVMVARSVREQAEAPASLSPAVSCHVGGCAFGPLATPSQGPRCLCTFCLWPRSACDVGGWG